MLSSHWVVSDFLWPNGLQHIRPSLPSPIPSVCSNSSPLSQWCHPTIFILCRALHLLSSIFLTNRAFSKKLVFRIRWPKLLELQLQYQSFQRIFRIDFLYDWLLCSPCCPRDSWDSSPTPQLKSINSPVLSFFYGLTLTSIHDYWKHHSSDYTDPC